MRPLITRRRGLGDPTRLFALGAFVAVAKIAATIKTLAYLGSVGFVNVAIGWTMLGVSGCHGGCCCIV